MGKKEGEESSVGLIDALKALLIDRKASTQEEICSVLENQGYEVNQSKISRLLRKMGVSKITNTKGQVVYSLPREPAPPSVGTSLSSLIVDVASNEVLVVIFTTPGAASMIARMLDYNQASTEILGTLAGDDTIFVTPKSTKNISKLLKEVKSLLNV